MDFPLIVDAHQDLGWNMLTFGRDYSRPAEETRLIERQDSSIAPQHNGDTLLGWPDYQAGQVAMIFSTLFASPERRKLGDWETQTYQDFDQAHKRYHAQLEAYHRLTETYTDKFRLIQTQPDLENLLSEWETPGMHPVGLTVLMEGAEGVRTPEELSIWWQHGVRLIGPAWAGTRFCGGTREPGPLTPDGFALLKGMASLGFGLDLSHMDEQAVLQALDIYPGEILASHANVKALLPGTQSNRFLSDRVIAGILERDGVIGVVPFNRFLDIHWQKGDDRAAVSLVQVVTHIDYICQMAGNARHVGFGTDFDGGFGQQSVPAEINTIADLPQIADLLTQKGYTQEDIAAIFGENWLRKTRQILPTV